MSYLECEEQEIPFDSVDFEHDGQKFYCSGIACHVVYKNDNGIGSYEYWGHREYDSRIEWNSEAYAQLEKDKKSEFDLFFEENFFTEIDLNNIEYIDFNKFK